MIEEVTREEAHKMSDNVHSLAYTHIEDGDDYKHDFAKGVCMIAVGRIVILYRPDKEPLSGDF